MSENGGIRVYLFNVSKKSNSTYQPAISSGTVYEGIVLNVFNYTGLTIRFNFGLPVTKVPAYNYAYIPSIGNRYYWITWTYEDGFWKASLDEDYLASHKTAIGNSTQYVVRSSVRNNDYLVDNKRPSTTNIQYSSSEFEIIQPEDVNKHYYWKPLGATYIDAQTSATRYYANCIMILNLDKYQIKNKTTTENCGMTIIRLSYHDALLLIDKITKLYGSDYVNKAILGFYLCPFCERYQSTETSKLAGISLAYLSTWTELTRGDINLDDTGASPVIDAYLVDSQYMEYSMRASIPVGPNVHYWQRSNVGRSIFIEGAPFSKTQLNNEPFIGGNGINLHFLINTLTGDTKLTMDITTNDVPIVTKTGLFVQTMNLYSVIPYVSGGIGDVAQRNLQLGLAAVKLVFSSAVGVASGNYAIAAAGVADAATQVASEGLLEQVSNDVSEAMSMNQPAFPDYNQLVEETALRHVNDIQAYNANKVLEKARNKRNNRGIGALAVSSFAGQINDIFSAGRTSTVQNMSSGNLTAGYENLKLVIEDSTFVDTLTSYIGDPLCKEEKISSLGGYIQCESPKLSTDGMVLEENLIIRSAMASGFYYE